MPNGIRLGINLIRKRAAGRSFIHANGAAPAVAMGIQILYSMIKVSLMGFINILKLICQTFFVNRGLPGDFKIIKINSDNIKIFPTASIA